MSVVPTGSWPDTARRDDRWDWTPRPHRPFAPLTGRDAVALLTLVLLSVAVGLVGVLWLGAGHSGADVDQAGRHAVIGVGSDGRHN